jgi:hypothetical protein
VSTIIVNGSRASVIGFEGDAGYRLMVFNRSCVGARCKRLSQPIMYDLGDRMAVAWIDGKQVYVLVADRRGEATIRQIHEILRRRNPGLNRRAHGAWALLLVPVLRGKPQDPERHPAPASDFKALGERIDFLRD